MSRTHLLALSALAAAAAFVVTLSGADCILMLKPFVHQAKLAGLSLGLVAMAALASRPGPSAARARVCVGVWLAGMTGCYAGLLLIANLPDLLTPAWLAAAASACVAALLALRRGAGWRPAGLVRAH